MQNFIKLSLAAHKLSWWQDSEANSLRRDAKTIILSSLSTTLGPDIRGTSVEELINVDLMSASATANNQWSK